MLGLKKCTVAVEIVWMWGHRITEEGAISVAEAEDVVREGAIT